MAKKILALFFISILGLINCNAQNSYKQLIYQGNEFFNKKDYAESSFKNREAVELNQKDFTGHYNLGNSLYKENKFDEANLEYQKAKQLAKNKMDKAAALYNAGNVYMKSNQIEKAANYYKQALKQDPYNANIQKNYQIAKQKQKQKEQQQQQNQQNQEKSDNNKDQDNKKDGTPNSEKDGKKQDGGDQQNPNNGSGNKDESKNQPKPKDENGSENMPKSLQNAILNRVENKERETAQRILNKSGNSFPQSNEKDW